MEYTHLPTISCYYADENKESLSSSPHAHFEYQMILVTGGRASFFINHQQYNVDEKSLVFISRLERHSFVVQEMPYERYVASMSGSHIMTKIKDEELLSIFLQRPKEFCHVIKLSDEAFDIILPHFDRLANEYTNQAPFYVTRCATLVVAILIDLYRINSQFFPQRSHTNISDAVINAQRYVNEHYDRQITLQEIADANFVNRHSLSIAFKDIVGSTFKDYLIQFRISEAKKLLITTDFSVAQIAEKVGYQNVNNFVQIFKSKESVTPLQYRKQSHLSKQIISPLSAAD